MIDTSLKVEEIQIGVKFYPAIILHTTNAMEGWVSFGK
jgi:hypothetical protein